MKNKEVAKKLNKISEKIYIKLKENLPFILIFTLLFICLFFMHHLISMYYDDFGNASLSYNQGKNELYNEVLHHINGTNYSFHDLITWCKMIYNSWGGRIIYAALILIPLLKYGVVVYMFLQSAVLTLIIYFIYKIVTFITKEKNSIIPWILFILYLLIDIAYLRSGIYWSSASILYIWPLLPLFAFIYLFMKLSEKIRMNEKVNYYLYLPILLILNFFAVFSQEQIGTSLMVFIILYIAFEHRKEFKKYLKLDIPNVIVAVVGYLLLILAPGNYARMNVSGDFANLNIIEKVLRNTPLLLEEMFAYYVRIFMIIFTIVFLICLWKNRNKLKISNKVIAWSTIGFLLFTVICFVVYKTGIKLFAFYGFIWIIYIGVWILIYGIQLKKQSIIYLSLAGCSSLFCLVCSPALGDRTNLPFIFYMFLLIAIFSGEFYKNIKSSTKMIFIIAMLPFLLCGIGNYYKIYKGYLGNYSIEKLNFSILKNYDEGETIILYKYRNSSYGAMRSYDSMEDKELIEHWMKKYFNIPEEVKIEWIDLYEDIRQYFPKE